MVDVPLSSATERATQDVADVHARKEVAHDGVGTDAMDAERGRAVTDLPPCNRGGKTLAESWRRGSGSLTPAPQWGS